MCGQDRSGQVRSGQVRTGQDRTGQDRTGQDGTGQDRTGQDRTGQDRARHKERWITNEVALGETMTSSVDPFSFLLDPSFHLSLDDSSNFDLPSPNFNSILEETAAKIDPPPDQGNATEPDDLDWEVTLLDPQESGGFNYLQDHQSLSSPCSMTLNYAPLPPPSPPKKRYKTIKLSSGITWIQGNRIKKHMSPEEAKSRGMSVFE
eukprot:768374-Hanusia_phi.AAC.2